MPYSQQSTNLSKGAVICVLSIYQAGNPAQLLHFGNGVHCHCRLPRALRSKNLGEGQCRKESQLGMSGRLGYMTACLDCMPTWACMQEWGLCACHTMPAELVGESTPSAV
eukprot:scaffold116911_cov18-Tisochrysis_lutea.AAC.1